MKTKSKRKAQILKGLMRAAEALQEPNRLSCVQIARWTDRKYSFNVGQEFPDSEAIKYAKFVTGGKGFRSFISESGDCFYEDTTHLDTQLHRQLCVLMYREAVKRNRT